MSSQKGVADGSHAPCIFVGGPDPSKPCHCGELALELSQFFTYSLIRSGSLLADESKHLFIFLNESNYGFSVIFCDIFSLIAESFACIFSIFSIKRYGYFFNLRDFYSLV